MRPAKFRNLLGFAAPLSILTASPSLSAPLDMARLADTAPIAMIAGALAFGGVAAWFVRGALRQNREAVQTAAHGQAAMRATLDDFESLLHGLPELTLVWRGDASEPQIFGQGHVCLPPGRSTAEAADFRTWLTAGDADYLLRHLNGLRREARGFETSMTTRDGRLMRVIGRAAGATAILRIRPATSQPNDGEAGVRPQSGPAFAESLFANLDLPAWRRDKDGYLVFANRAFIELANEHGPVNRPGDLPDLFSRDDILAQQDRLARGENTAPARVTIDDAGSYDLVQFALEQGTAGFLRPLTDTKAPEAPEIGMAQIAGIIDAIAIPIAIFDGARQLRYFNTAYCGFWDLDPNWLKSGLDEGAILDRLRTRGQLPSEADYRAWRAKHLSAYGLKSKREDLWYLPDGRTLNVTAVPTSAHGGVIYAFEDISERLALESRYNAMIHVQHETLSALSEGVAVFGTNGRLTLHNPRLSQLWALPMNELGQHPHIDQIGEACARAMPEDGRVLWQSLKQRIVDLNPTRRDTSGRLNRADGRLIDYAVTRLPDGQTMMSFVDVTDSANYERVLKERNEALVTADRLKDAFVQNVSYELRSPLTNIIGFADLLATGTAGELNERQKAYTDYIRASSQTLGVLIDNILDLATVDAGVAELKLERNDVGKLVERARAGLAGTMATEAGDRQVNLVVDMPDNLPPLVADGTRIVQVLYNLLSNAVRYSPSGAVVKLTVEERAEHIAFIVDDEGAGTSDDVRSAVNAPQGKQVEGRQRDAGLGLAIVKTFVNLHGGAIRVEPREPHGTKVTVTLPITPAEAISAAE